MYSSTLITTRTSIYTILKTHAGIRRSNTSDSSFGASLVRIKDLDNNANPEDFELRTMCNKTY